MGLVSELRRRNVFRMAVLYAIAAWLIMQVAEVLNDLANLPEWVGPIILGVLAVGFPIALILSWFYELTPAGISLEKDVDRAESITHITGRRLDFIVISLLCAAVILFAYDKWWLQGPPEKSIAVLPFDNVSDDPDTHYLGEGISESLIMRLSRVPRLRVKSRAVIRDSDMDVQTLGRLLDVEAICIGRLVQRGDRLEIIAELVDTSDGTVIWSDRYDRPASSLLTIESEISAEIARQLRSQLTGDEEEALARAPTDNPEAYRLYLQGRYLWNQRTPDGLKRSAEFYKRAIDLDPNYALAWSGLADSFLMLFAWGIEPPAEAAPRVVAAAERAIELDPTLAEPHATLGYFKTLYEWDWEGARQEFLLPIELNNNYSTAHHWYAFYLVTIGDMSAAIDEILLARDSEPLSPVINSEFGYFYLVNRQYDQALDELQRARLYDPAYNSTVRNLVKVYALLGRRDEAIAMLERWRETAEGNVLTKVYGGVVLPMLGFEEEARAIYQEMLEMSQVRYVMPVLLGTLAASIGELDAAFAHFDRALEERSLIISLLRDPMLDSIRDDPRFAQVFEQVGLEP